MSDPDMFSEGDSVMKHPFSHSSRISLFSVLAVPLLGGIFLSGCDVDGSQDMVNRSIPEGSEPASAPELCGEGIELPENASITATATGEMRVTTMYEDPVARMTGATVTDYWCECISKSGGAGVCNVTNPSGNYLGCLSDTCNPGTCKLQQSNRSSLNAFSDMLGSCSDSSSFNDEIVSARSEQIDAWSKKQGFPDPIIEFGGHEATATKGFGLVAEVVGGRTLTYQVPDHNFDENGDLITFVGPVNNGLDPIAQVAGGGNLKCRCEGANEGGTCSWVNKVCSGPCVVAPGFRGCVVSSKVAKPIKN